MLDRRTVLRLPALGAVGVGLSALTGLTACDQEDDVPAETPGARRETYGTDPSQFGELHLPAGEPRGTVVVIHGGFWQAAYDYTLGTPLAESLADEGWAAWNLEYRRVGNGGGTPATFDDVARGIDRLRDLDVPLDTVVTLGHSAGGHLAAWAAARDRYDFAADVAVTHVVSQAGVLDLVAGDVLGGGAVQSLLGHPPTAADERYDPQQQVPLDVPVWCVHGTDDVIVPLSQSQDYVAAAVAAGAEAEVVEVDGDHFVVIDPASAAWTSTLEILDAIAPAPR
ncbi:alpha/beta hydrolase [Nocardioides sp. C4-1]|uniref:alpha/beta hydrolase family protein n=1 Tax=Nocardioides sp. C4-1 TaxID=3151851 RepID=UPI003262D557